MAESITEKGIKNGVFDALIKGLGPAVASGLQRVETDHEGAGGPGLSGVLGMFCISIGV